jgi:sentrin-specific protease 1
MVILNVGTWLNDEVINYYMCMLMARDVELSEHCPGRKTSHYYNSFFINKLVDQGGYSYSNVRRYDNATTNAYYDIHCTISDDIYYNTACHHLVFLCHDFSVRWSKKFDILSKRRIYCPINISNNHWTLGVIYMEEKKVVYYDSMSGSGRK